MQVGSAYTPSKWGEIYHNLMVWEALGAGSAGPGKTEVLIAEPIPQIVMEDERCRNKNHPHHIEWGQSVGWALYLRRTRPRQEQNIQRASRLYNSLEPGVRWDEKKGIFTFRSGYKVQYGHCKDPKDWEQYYSSEYTLVMFDELVEFLEEQYLEISGRCRTTDPVLINMLKIRSMSNPVRRADKAGNTVEGIIDPYWVRKRFVDPCPEGNKILRRKVTLSDGTEEIRDRIYLPAKLHDNPNKEFVRQYETTLRMLPLHIQKALLDGDWYVTAGSFFAADWNPIYHVCEPFHIPNDWPRFRAMDWGFKTNGVVLWFAVDPDGNLFVEREFSFKEMLVNDVAAVIKEIETKLHLWKYNQSRITGPADTQLWEERGDSGLTKAMEFQKRGISWVQADKSRGSRHRHAERLITRLRDHRDGTTTAGIVYFNTCVKCVQTIPAIQTDPHNPEVPLSGGEDHWLDTTFYAVTYASFGSVGTSVDNIMGIRDEFDEDDFETYESEQERGMSGYGV